MIPSLENKLGNALVKVSKLLKVQGLISNNKEMAGLHLSSEILLQVPTSSTMLWIVWLALHFCGSSLG